MAAAPPKINPAVSCSNDGAANASVGATSRKTAGANQSRTVPVLSSPAPGISSNRSYAPTEALAAPSFEQLTAGLIFGGSAATAGRGRAVSRDYKEITRDPELGTPDQTGTFDLLADPRAELTVSLLPAKTTLTVVADDAAPTLDKTRTNLVDRQTGVVIATRGSWSAAHQSSLAADRSVILAPSWEVLT